MKVNFGNERLGTPIKNIFVGETFFCSEKVYKRRKRSLYED